MACAIRLAMIACGLVTIACSSIPRDDRSAAADDAAAAAARMPASLPLDGTPWRLASQAGSGGSRLAPTARIAVRFEDGHVVGTAGCNRINAPYTIQGVGLRVEGGATTMMACAAPVMADEATFLSNLARVTAFAIADERLTLVDGSGEPVLVFEQERSPALTGTRWTAINVNNGREAVVSVVAGTEITAEFRDDGSVSGSAGCNSWRAQATVAGDTLRFSPPVATKKLCMQPDGVMEQETAFLRAVESVALHRIDGDVMEWRTASGALAASFRAAQP